MPCEIISLDKNSSPDSVVDKTVAAFRSGRLVLLPTDTIYGLAARASEADAVGRLLELKGRENGHPLSLAVSDVRMLLDYVPNPGKLGLRFARRCFPGALTLVLDGTDPVGELDRLPESVLKAVRPQSTVGFRIPAHAFVRKVIEKLGEPIVLSSANRTGKSPAKSVKEAVKTFGDGLGLAIDEGPLSASTASTVLKVIGDEYEILREGGISNLTIERMKACIVLFVCTGNTCRSPMAEAICEAVLAERIGVPLEELEEYGYVVASAGVMAANDAPASHGALEAMRSRGLSLNDHQAQRLNETHIRFADHIYTMTRGHREAILSQWPEADARLSVLRVDGGDVADPIGGSATVYADCALQIESEIRKRAEEILSR